MASLSLYHCLYLLLLVSGMHGNKEIQDMIDQVSSLQGDLLKKIIPAYIDSQVEQALSRILGDTSIYDRVSQLKQNQRQMYKHFNDVKTRLNALENQRAQPMKDTECLMKRQQQCDTGDLHTKINILRDHMTGVEVNLGSISETVLRINESCVEMSETLEREANSIWESLTRFNVTYLNDINMVRNEVQEIDIQSNNRLNNATKILETNITSLNLRQEEVETDMAMLSQNITLMGISLDQQMSKISNNCQCIDTSVSIPVTTLSTATVKSRYESTTNNPGDLEEMNRLLVVQRVSGNDKYPQQIHINNGEMSTYSYLHTSHVMSVTYDPTSRRVIFSRYEPDGIFSSSLDVTGVETLKTKVNSWGMVVDVEKRLIFMTTVLQTISRMTTRGTYYRRIVDVRLYGSYNPTGIAIDEGQRMIYFCMYERMLSVDYEGENVRTIVNDGNNIYAVAFDPVRNCIYFGMDMKVIMTSLSTNETTEIMDYKRIWTFDLYNNSLFINYYSSRNIDVINLDNNVRFTLGQVDHYDNIITVIP